MKSKKLLSVCQISLKDKNQEVIDAISKAIRSTEGVSLSWMLILDPLQIEQFTPPFVGSPDAVIEGALNAARVAYKLIDMAKHKEKFAEKLSAELKVPIYLYGYASDQEYRKAVPQIRAGEYEGILKRYFKWKPDFGPTEFVPSWGATMAGARKFLIAYNVNILGTKEQAHRIALDIREQGRNKDEPGKLKKCQAIGWWLDEANLAQVSINLTDHDVTPIHTAYEEVCKGAKDLKLAVTGSQIVGIVPLRAILQVAEFYINKENLFVLEEDQKLHLAINRLGLNSLGLFSPKERIIEYMLPDDDNESLINKSVQDFIKTVAARTPAPGGGSVAAAVGAMGSALACMVGQMTYGKRQWERYDSQMRRIIPIMHETMKDLISVIDADTNAFNDYMAALKLPKETTEDIVMRETAMEAGLKKAISIPMSVAKSVGVKCLETGVLGAYYNVIINAEGIKDEKYKTGILNEIEEYRTQAEKAVKKFY
ncbi:formimidoyltransferase-cyclodeaminase [Caerostris extrusa]|uniref:glutamate formimidoyltransferase n=1 Tax=Caerostris extrusa TaxID=172846 RepID=A0AAV4P9E2_CAEEX|nr:formimidoyltransferase-cyclodeaminase [Caerostris extrusa]